MPLYFVCKSNALKVFAVFSFSFFSSFIHAQLCIGTLGDPIVNITFGEGYFAPLPLSNTDYTFANGCPGPGEYTISSFLLGCGDGTWFPLTGDHSRVSSAANYMLVNGAGKAGLVIRQTATGLCGNTTYEFAGWVSNVMQQRTCGGAPVLPNLTFTVETLAGSVLASYTTGNIPLTDSRTWKQYGVFFKTPADVNSIILSITSDATGVCGSGFSLDDITLKACGPPVTITVDGADIPYIEVCAGYTNPFILNATYSSSFIDPLFQWQNSFDTGKTWQDIPGANSTSYSIPRRDSGTVIFRMQISDSINFSSPQCRVSSNAIYTGVHLLPKHQPTTNLIGCLGKDFVLSSSNPTILKYDWRGPNGFHSNISTPVIHDVQYADTGIYAALLTADYGCSVEDSFYLRVYPGTTVSVEKEHSICEGNSVTLAASGDGDYTWTPAIGLSNNHIANPVASPKEYTQYKVVLTNIYGCKDSAFVNIHVNKNIELSAPAEKNILAGDTITINASVAGTEVEYYWSPPSYINDILSITPKVYPPSSTEYILTANSTVGCGSKTAVVKIKVFQGFFVPNAFTPNGDGLNDKFNITPLDDYILDKFIIYNRWGKPVFKTTDANKGWDGTVSGSLQSTGTYIYYLQMESPTGNKIERKGTILLLR